MGVPRGLALETREGTTLSQQVLYQGTSLLVPKKPVK
jgi:hypothetical protein